VHAVICDDAGVDKLEMKVGHRGNAANSLPRLTA
jgi:hypothetical protein